MRRRTFLEAGMIATMSGARAFLSAAEIPSCVSQPGGIPAEQQKYVDGLTAAENNREQSLKGYSAREEYTVYRRGNSDPAATRILQAEYVKGQGKQYTELHRDGSGAIQSKLIDRLQSEQRAMSLPGEREKTLLTLDNYKMLLKCVEIINGRSLVRIAISPRTKTTHVFEGSILIDPMTYHLVRIEGILAKSPTLWASNPRVVRDYSDRQGFFLASHASSVSHSMLFGETQVEIAYTYDSIR